MASYSSTASFLRSSVFDAALDLGLVDPKMTSWLEDVPELPSTDDKLANYATPGILPSSSGHDQALSSPESDFSHNSHVTGVTSPSTSSHDGTPLYPRAGPPPRGLLREKYEFPNASSSAFAQTTIPLQKIASPPASVGDSIPPSKGARKTAKLVKKPRPAADSKNSSVAKGRSSQEKRINAEEAPTADDRDRYAFLNQEPIDKQQEKESRSFFGRLRDRSRSKSRARKGAPSDDVGKRSEETLGRRSDEDKRQGGSTGDVRGRSGARRQVQLPTVTVTVKDGAPQLQLEPRSNRQSADLLSSMNLVGRSSSSPFTMTPTPITQPTTSYNWSPPRREVTPDAPIPRNGTMLDRPHPKVRTSGFWANKDRGAIAASTRAANFRSGPGTMGRRSSQLRKNSSIRGVRKVPSVRRHQAPSTANTRSSSGSTVTSVINAVVERQWEDIDEDVQPEAGYVVEDDGYGGTSFLSNPSTPGIPDHPEPKIDVPVTSVPVIIERQPSVKSTRSSNRPVPLSLSLLTANSTMPRLASPSSLSPSSPLRSPASARLRRFSRNVNLPPSPLRPPTSPLPPTPTSAPSPGGLATSAAGQPSPTVPSSAPESDWFEDDDSSAGDPRTRGSGSSPSSPLMPTDDYIVPTPSAFTTSFHIPAPESSAVPVELSISKPIPRPQGRAALTPEGRARAGSFVGSFVGSSARRPITPQESSLPPSPRPSPNMSSQQSAVARPAEFPAPHARAAGFSRNGSVSAGKASLLPQPGRTMTTATLLVPPVALGVSDLAPRSPNSPNKPVTPTLSRFRSTPDLAAQDEGSSRPVSPNPPLPAMGSASGTQRGRTSPFPVHPTTNLPSLTRSPSTVNIRRGERVRSVHVEIGQYAAPIPSDPTGRQSSESFGTDPESNGTGGSLAPELSPTSGFLKRRPSVVEPLKIGRVARYNNIPLGAFIPTAKASFESKQVTLPRSIPPSPAAQRSATSSPMSRMPSLRQLAESQPRRTPEPRDYPPLKPLSPAPRPRPSVNIIRSSMTGEAPAISRAAPLTRQGSFPPTHSVYKTERDRDSSWTQKSRSMYSTGEGASTDTEDDDRFGLELDDEDSGRGFDVIAARLGNNSRAGPDRAAGSKTSTSRHDMLLRAVRDVEARGARSPPTLVVPSSSLAGLSPIPPLRRKASAGAGGARWI